MNRRTALPTTALPTTARRTTVTAVLAVVAIAAATGSTATAAVATTTATGAAAVPGTAAQPVPPVVELTSPRTGWGYDAPARIYLRATASSATSTISTVEFLHNDTVIGTDEEAPYETLLDIAEDGKHQLSARAYDADGLSATSPAATVAVATPPSITLRGLVEPGAETGCLVMVADGVVYELHRGDPKVVYAGAWVLITGLLPRYAGSTCQQGQILFITAAEPIDPGGPGGPGGP